MQGPSPARLFYKRYVRSGVLPEIYRAIDPTQDAESRRQQEKQDRFKMVCRHATPLLKLDQEVRLQDKQTKRWDIRAFVRHRRPHGRSYIVETDSGSCFLRNRRFLKPVQHTRGPAEQEQEQEQEHQTQETAALTRAASREQAGTGVAQEKARRPRSRASGPRAIQAGGEQE